MAKGSQLSQLKTALNQAGLTRQPQQNSKKRKRNAVLDDKEKERRAAKLKEIQQKMNPFDTKVTKLKHDVGGRKIVGTVGRPAQSKQAGIEQRKKTLLKEYEERDRAGGIVDRRFGENDPSMSLEERMLERFTRERQRTSKGDVFNLEDDDELTHYGQSLSKLDDFDNVGLGLDEEEDEDGGLINKKTVMHDHFGGFSDDEESDEEDQPERKKTKAEVMAEVIAKSKEHKMLRQTQQDMDEKLRHELDEEFDSIRSLLYAPTPAAKIAPEEILAELHKEPTSTSAATVTSSEVVLSKDSQPGKENEDQEYDQYVRELAFEARAKPKDRTKTEEELAKEEKEALEKAERRRIRRMNGEPDESDDEDSGGVKKGKKRDRGGDDLDDDFYEEDDEWNGLGAGLGVAGKEVDKGLAKGDEGSDVEDDEEDEGSDEEDEGSEEGEDEDEYMESQDEAEGEEGDAEALVPSKKASKGKKKTTSSTSELPFTFPCPESHDEFLEIIQNVSDSDVPTVVKRIRTLHHPSLAEDNKYKLQALTGVLLDHILYVTAPPSPKFSPLSSIIPHLFALTKSYPIQSAQHFISKLNLMQKNLKRGLSNGVTQSASKTWPGLPELSLLRVVSIIWPTSDMNHHVVSPARLLMGSYLGLCRIRSLQDIASGLFLSTLFLQYEELSRRFVPEAINLLANSLLILAPHKFKDVASLPGSFPSPDVFSEKCQALKIESKKAKKLTPRRPDLAHLLTSDDADEQSKLDLLGVSTDLLAQFGELYKSLDGFIELYQPLVTILEAISTKSLPSDLATKISSTHDTLSRLLKFAKQGRQPLHLQGHKPIPIATYVPKFEHTTSNYLRNRDPDHERNEAAKIRAQYKQEKKGAIRELRKDARFLASEQQRKQKAKDKEYNDRMKRVFSTIEGERAEQKALEREKMRDKKRSGRK
ncbi:nucleolar protein 14 [Abortiporus biennis]|nr:nucleolar protein 14 [Abortiporus biennis]